MSGILTAIFQPVKVVRQVLHAVSVMSPNISMIKPDIISLSSIRTKVRCYFPRPNEVRRVRRHGWETRTSTPNGRRIIMRRILKGRYVLTH